MFARLGRFVVAHPWRVIAVWVVAAVALVAFAPKLSDITNNDQTSFLPKSYESAQAQEVAARAFPRANDTSAIVVVKRSDSAPLTEADQTKIVDIAQGLQAKKIPTVAAVLAGPQLVSQNKRIGLIQVAFTGTIQDKSVTNAVKSVRADLPALMSGTDLQAGVTGTAAIGLDSTEKFVTAEKVVGIVTITLIVVLMLLMFRSPIAALLPIVTIGVVMQVANALIALAGKIFNFQISEFLPVLLTVVLFGIGTDYMLFLLFRYRERLRRGDESHHAVTVAVHRIGEAIASAAAVVIVAFGALVLSSFKAFATMGPGLAIAVATMLLAALTLVPAVVSLVGPRVFWPSKGWQSKPQGGLSKAAGGLVRRRPKLVAGVGVLLFLALSAGVFNLKQSYESIAAPPSGTESATWYTTMQAGFPAGVTTPTTVEVVSTSGGKLDPAALATYAQRLAKVDGVGQVQPAGVDANKKPVLFALSKDGTAGQISVLLKHDPFSSTAMDVVQHGLRDTAHADAPPGTKAYVGGMTSAFVDVRSATNRDMSVIFPLAALLILIILALMLRALVAPLYLMVAVGLGFLATLGAATWVFQTIGGEPGVMFMLPIIVYLFVVAIGTDYNILMIARLREEAQLGLQPRAAADMAVEHAGPSIASAGVILAGTFSALLFAGLTILSQIGFAVAVGIVLAAFVMSMFVVPSVTSLVGHAAWWPGHGDMVRASGGDDGDDELDAELTASRH